MYNTKNNRNTKYGLWMIVMCCCRFVNGYKGPTQVGAVENGEGYAWGTRDDIWELFVPSPQFYCHLKLLLKNKLNKNNKSKTQVT